MKECMDIHHIAVGTTAQRGGKCSNGHLRHIRHIKLYDHACAAFSAQFCYTQGDLGPQSRHQISPRWLEMMWKFLSLSITNNVTLEPTLTTRCTQDSDRSATCAFKSVPLHTGQVVKLWKSPFQAGKQINRNTGPLIILLVKITQSKLHSLAALNA